MPLKSPFFAKYWFDQPYRQYCAQRRRLLVYITSRPDQDSYAVLKVRQ